MKSRDKIPHIVKIFHIMVDTQYGAAEEKNRHLLETAGTLLFHRQVLKKYSLFAILTDAFIIR